MNYEDKDRTIYLYDDGVGKVQLVQAMGTDATVVHAARVSFGKDNQNQELSERDLKLIDYLIRNKHTSTLEHCSVTFKFVVPLFVRSQHHRHRTWSYNEISRRYTEENLQFYEPKQFRTQHKSNRQASNTDELIDPQIDVGSGEFATIMPASTLVKNWHSNSIVLYNRLMDAGVCREQARGVLPQNLYTEYYGSANVNNILKFVDLRIHEGAQWEIQKVGEAVLDIVTELFPETVGAYRRIRDEKHGS